MTLLGIGPEWIIGDATGGTAYFTIAAVIFALIGTGAVLMPLLTDYGLLEFIGTLLRGFFQRVFQLPGRSTIDALASWVGSSSIAVLVTSRQYEGGFYTAREAAVIATNFSVVSVPFRILLRRSGGYCGVWRDALRRHGIDRGYLRTDYTEVTTAIGNARRYYAPVGKQIHEEVDDGIGILQWPGRRHCCVPKVVRHR